MENQSRALAAGVFVLTLAGLLIALAVWLTRDIRQYQEYELSTSAGVSGLQAQASVRYKGVAVGKVTRIGFDPQVAGNVLIRIAVSADAPVTPGTFAVLGYQGVTGLAHVQLDHDAHAASALPPGPSGLPRLPLRSSPLSLLADQGHSLLSRADAVSQQLLQILGPDNQQRISQALDSLGAAADAATQLARTLERGVAAAQVPQLAQQTRRTLQALERGGDSAAAVAAALQHTLEHVHAADGPLAQITQTSQAISRLADALQHDTLPQTQHTLAAIARAAEHLGAAANSLRENPQALIYGPAQGAPGPGEAGFAPPLGAGGPSGR